MGIQILSGILSDGLRCFVWSDLDPNCFQRILRLNRRLTSAGIKKKTTFLTHANVTPNVSSTLLQKNVDLDENPHFKAPISLRYHLEIIFILDLCMLGNYFNAFVVVY